jgi:hypothetical protein
MLSIAVADDNRMDVDLTAEGVLDWAHWGTNVATSFDHKAGAGLISDATGAGSMFLSDLNFRWTDGSPTQSASTKSGVYANAAPSAISLSAQATTTLRTLRLYVGGDTGASASMTAHLSDGSAADAVLPAMVAKLYVTLDVTFRAASDQQQVSVTWTLTTPDGAINLKSASLF